jgi:acyl carrier protein
MTDLHLEHVRWALALHLDVDPATIAPETTLAVLGLDPFDLVLVLLRLEELTGTELPIVELEHLRTVGDLVAVVREQDDPVRRTTLPPPPRTESGFRYVATPPAARRRA